MELDIIMVSVVLISSVVAFFRGFIKEMLTIVGLGGAAVISVLFGARLGEFLERWFVDPEQEDQVYLTFIPAEVMSMGVGYIALFIFTFLALAVMGYFLSKGAEAAGLGPIDRSLGVLFGIFRGALVVSVIYFSFSIFIEEGEEPQFMKDSKLLPFVSAGVDWTLDVTGFEKPFQDKDDEGEDENAVDKAADAIEKVKEAYIETEKAADALKETQGKLEGEEGYAPQERDALKEMIENGASESGGNP